MSSRICFPFPIRNGSTTTFCPFNPGNTFSTEGNAPKYASAMSVPSGSRNFNCWRNCAGSGAASLPVTPWATTSREASPSNSFCKAAALKPTPPHPAPHTGLKISSGCCPLPAYSARPEANPPPSGCGKTPARHNRLNIETAPPHAAAIQPLLHHRK